MAKAVFPVFLLAPGLDGGVFPLRRTPPSPDLNHDAMEL